MNDYIFFWFIVALFFLIVEMSSPGLFYFLSFSCAALVASIADILCLSIFNQVFIFLIAVIGAFFLLRMWVRHTHTQSHYHSNIYAMQGKNAVIITSATNIQFGYVCVDGQVWAYKAKDNKQLPIGSTVLILRVQGAHLIVDEK